MHGFRCCGQDRAREKSLIRRVPDSAISVARRDAYRSADFPLQVPGPHLGSDTVWAIHRASTVPRVWSLNHSESLKEPACDRFGTFRRRFDKGVSVPVTMATKVKPRQVSHHLSYHL
jgi:hypothetical protein